MTDLLKQTTLIIAGHGSTKNPNQARPAREHAEAIKQRSLFANVKTAFWKEDVRLSDALENVTTPEVVIVPNLACSGYINQVVIPKEMGLDGALSLRTGQRIHLCKPVGEHPSLPALMAQWLKDTLQSLNLDATETTVFLVAHGNPDPERPASHDTTVMLATRMYSHFPVHAILPAFLEEKPFLNNWDKRANTQNIVVLPFMIAAGTHGARDIPRDLGIELPDDIAHDLHENGTPAGPFDVSGGRKIWLMRAMGAHPQMADLIVDIAREQLTQNS